MRVSAALLATLIKRIRKDGSLIDVEISTSIVVLNDEKLFISFVRDISERKRTERYILHARDEAERASRAKTDFLSRMSHELRTPLNAILGFSQLLKMDTDRLLTISQTQQLQEIISAGKHLLSLVDEILDLSRIESGHLDLKLAPQDINAILEESITQIIPLADERDISIKTEIDAQYFVNADQTRLKQVCLNLLSNAVKYNHNGGEILIHHEKQDDILRVNVVDTGIGIPVEVQNRLFRPFERVASAYEAIEGTGIGLALTKHLIENMGGKIGVDSAKDAGSNFWFELKLVELGND